MKIGINARFLTHPYTGIGQYTLHLLQALGQIDQKNQYFIFTPELVDLPLPENFHQVRVPEKYQNPSLAKAHWEHILIPEEMKRWEVELAHFLYPANPTRGLNIPTIVTVHDVIPWVLPEYRQRARSRAYHAYARMALKKARHIITVSDFSKGEVQNLLGVKDNAISVIHLAPSTELAKPLMSDLPLRKDFLLYVGGYDDRKNVPLLMEAYMKYIANHYPIDLILVGAQGHGLEAFLTDEYKHKVDGRIPVRSKGDIIFTPPLSTGELAYLYRHAKAFVHASVYEGFNLPLVEAMSFGLPMVVSDLPVNREVTDEGAYFADPTNPDTFGLGLHEFINNSRMMDELKKRSILRSKDFSWRKVAEETLYVYNLFG